MSTSEEKESPSTTAAEMESFLINLDKEQIVEFLKDPYVNEACQNHVRGVVKQRIDTAKEQLLLAAIFLGSAAAAALQGK